jgi:hypothetical protein
VARLTLQADDDSAEEYLSSLPSLKEGLTGLPDNLQSMLVSLRRAEQLWLAAGNRA